MDKQDIQVVAVPGGFDVKGFLNITCGQKFAAVLASVSAPTDKDDPRTAS